MNGPEWIRNINKCKNILYRFLSYPRSFGNGAMSSRIRQERSISCTICLSLVYAVRAWWKYAIFVPPPWTSHGNSAVFSKYFRSVVIQHVFLSLPGKHKNAAVWLYVQVAYFKANGIEDTRTSRLGYIIDIWFTVFDPPATTVIPWSLKTQAPCRPVSSPNWYSLCGTVAVLPLKGLYKSSSIYE